MSDRKVNVAIAGATGAVGRAMLEILKQRNFPVDRLSLLASEKSAGERIEFRQSYLTVQQLDEFDFSDVDIALFAAGGSVARVQVPRAAEAGCVVIDNSSEFRYNDAIPLVVPEVNPHHIDERLSGNIIANPNCSTIQMMLAVSPIHDLFGVERLNVATYQSVSGAGNAGLEELARQTAALLNFQTASNDAFPAQIAFNVLPHIDSFQDNGYTREEMKMVWETRKILGHEDIAVNATAVRVPVFYGHSEALHLTTSKPVDLDQARSALKSMPGVSVVDEQSDGGYPTAVTHAAGNDAVYVGRIRRDLDSEHGLNLWVVSDNVRKGAALNAIQIAELLVKSHL